MHRTRRSCGRPVRRSCRTGASWGTQRTVLTQKALPAPTRDPTCKSWPRAPADAVGDGEA